MTFSFSAPTLSEEDVQNELASLPKDEIRSLERDVFGTSADDGFDDKNDDKNESLALSRNDVVEEADDVRDEDARAQATLYTALEKLSKHQTENAKKAIEEHPHLMASEAKPIYFLNTEDHDAKKSAIRFCKYWDVRVKIFGDRAFRPLKKGEALSDNDMKLLETMPEAISVTGKDKHGRVVVYCEYSGRDLTVFREDCFTLVRVMWAVMSQIIPLKSVQELGFVGITVVKSQVKMSRPQMKYTAMSFNEAFPCRTVANHICTNSQMGALVFRTFLFFVDRSMRLRTRVHHSEGGMQLVKEFQSTFGIPRVILPTRIGGDFRIDINKLDGSLPTSVLN